MSKEEVKKIVVIFKEYSINLDPSAQHWLENESHYWGMANRMYNCNMRVLPVFSPPPMVGDLREKIAKELWGFCCPGLELTDIDKTMYLEEADSILSLIDIDKMARERRWVKEIPDGMKAIMFMNAETGKEEIYFTPDTFNNLPEKEKTGYVKLERLLTEEEIRNASGHLSNPVSKLRANLQAQDSTYLIAFEAGVLSERERMRREFLGESK